MSVPPIPLGTGCCTWRYLVDLPLISSTKFDLDLKSMQYAIPCGQQIRDITLHLFPATSIAIESYTVGSQFCHRKPRGRPMDMNGICFSDDHIGTAIEISSSPMKVQSTAQPRIQNRGAGCLSHIQHCTRYIAAMSWACTCRSRPSGPGPSYQTYVKLTRARPHPIRGFEPAILEQRRYRGGI